jgi:hypothetical protein
MKALQTIASSAVTLPVARLLPVFWPVFLIGTFMLTGCAQSKWHEVHHTGDETFEAKTTNTKASDLGPHQQMFVSTDNLRARVTPEQPDQSVTCSLGRNDKVEVIDPTPKGRLQLVEVRITSSTNPKCSGQYFVPPQYLSRTPLASNDQERKADRYFMIQNIATQKLRIYERCDSKGGALGCPNRLVFETEMTPGEDTPDQSRRTLLGHYLISRWFKFYQDDNAAYPAWFVPNLPPIPAVGADFQDWFSPALFPRGKKSNPEGYRGAFGWYTAHLAPKADYQWIHGTIGWGADGEKFVKIPTHGCTRVSNPAVAYLHKILFPGTRVLKIYAKEDVRDPQLRAYQGQKIQSWNWVLTKPAASTTHTPKETLEQGTLEINAYPHVTKGNVYKIPVSSFQGRFLIDEGRLVNYEHPKELRVGGFDDSALPGIAVSVGTP